MSSTDNQATRLGWAKSADGYWRNPLFKYAKVKNSAYAVEDHASWLTWLSKVKR
jgi:hypothetical protein